MQILTDFPSVHCTPTIIVHTYGLAKLWENIFFPVINTVTWHVGHEQYGIIWVAEFPRHRGRKGPFN